METGNASATQERYYWVIFPIIPTFMLRKGDEWNSLRFGFRWLFFMITDQMTPWPSLSLELFSVRFSFLYLGFYFQLPPILKITRWSHQNLWRVGARSKYKWMR